MTFIVTLEFRQVTSEKLKKITKKFSKEIFRGNSKEVPS